MSVIQVEPYVGVKAMVRRICRSFEPEARRRGLRLTFHCARDLNGTGRSWRHGLPDLLRAVLSRALANTGNGGIHLQVEPDSEADGGLLFSVADTGSGVVSGATEAAWCELARRCDGSIQVESVAGVGTVVRIGSAERLRPVLVRRRVA